jgi:hypothetical protein
MMWLFMYACCPPMGYAPLQLASVHAFTEEDKLLLLACCGRATIERYRSSREGTSCSGCLLSNPTRSSRLKTVLHVTGAEQSAKPNFPSKRTVPVSQADHKLATVSHEGITGTPGACFPTQACSGRIYLVIEAIAYAWNGQDQLWTLGKGLDFLT